MIKIELPWPPSVNHYWLQRRGGGRYISERGVIFRRDVMFLTAKAGLKQFSEHSRLSIKIDVYPPDKRKRDLDNLLKATLDALQYAKIIFDDAQFDKLTVIRHTEKLGVIRVTVKEC